MSSDTGTNNKGIRWLQLFILLLLLAVFAAIIMLGRYQQFSDSALDIPGQEILYSVPPGSSLNKLAHDLHARNIIQYPRLLILLGRQMDAARRLQAGEYILQQGLTPRTLLEQLVEGKVNQYELTLIEGHSFREMLQRIHADPVLVHTLSDETDTGIMELLGRPGQHPEGRFLPDTYYFTRGMTDVEFLARAMRAMSDRLTIEWQQREEGLPLKSADEALILASIVEKETGAVEERPIIAGVFVRRLQKGMRLQTDPTVIYGMGDSFDGNIRKRDLLNDTPYNTYTRAGLPPTPIAMPGADAIRAVLHPAKGKSLYFVSMGEGRHYFSATLKQHNLAVDKFQKKKKGIKLPPSGHL
ncbi:MAG: endolytic transglycosylase MltG [Gammaproteobacteria bacterium]|nr:endolytic transglycosylase MltG [Gammaproteobacteria bacterium]